MGYFVNTHQLQK